jgi:hypothetical protein
MLSDIITEHVNGQSDLQVVGVVPRSWDLAREVGTAGADVLIVAIADEDGIAFESVLWAHPRLCILSVTREGRESYLHQLRPAKRRLGELSPEGVVAAVRDAARRAVTVPSEDA